jgi:hypothetical protein
VVLDPTIGSEIQKTRPCLVVSPDDMNHAVRTAIVSAAARRFGISISDARLVAPDRLRLVTPLGSIDGRLTIDPGGALGFDTRLGTVSILTIDPSLPLRLRSLAVVNGALRLDGILDAQALLGG